MLVADAVLCLQVVRLVKHFLAFQSVINMHIASFIINYKFMSIKKRIIYVNSTYISNSSRWSFYMSNGTRNLRLPQNKLLINLAKK